MHLCFNPTSCFRRSPACLKTASLSPSRSARPRMQRKARSCSRRIQMRFSRRRSKGTWPRLGAPRLLVFPSMPWVTVHSYNLMSARSSRLARTSLRSLASRLPALNIYGSAGAPADRLRRQRGDPGQGTAHGIRALWSRNFVGCVISGVLGID